MTSCARAAICDSVLGNVAIRHAPFPRAVDIAHCPLRWSAKQAQDVSLAAGSVAPRFTDDATHVASATVARADAIVSWNFKHIVRVDKMRAYNHVNLHMGFGLLTIVSPLEVRIDEDDQD